MSLRAWTGAFVAVAALAVVGLAVLMPRPGEPEALAICRTTLGAAPAATPGAAANGSGHGTSRALACLDGLEPTILTAELAGSQARWACQLHRGTPARPTLNEVRCAEHRGRGLRDEIRSFDARFFIPVYVAVSLLIAGGLVALGQAVPAGDKARYWRRALALTLVVTTIVLASLDGRENGAALRVLDAMDRAGAAAVAAGAPGVAAAAAADGGIDALAQAARARSLEKWLASAAWAAALGLALRVTLHRAWPDASPSSSSPPRWWRLAAWALPIAAWLGAATFAAGVIMAGTGGSALAWPVRLLGAGMGLTMLALVGAAAACGLWLWLTRAPAQPPSDAGEPAHSHTPTPAPQGQAAIS